MARIPLIPAALTQRPFSLQEARNAGLTSTALRGRAWRRLGSELYCYAEQREDRLLTLAAYQASLPAEAMFAGATAGWLHGLDLDPCNPVNVAVPPTSGIRPRSDLAVRRCVVPAIETVIVRGLRATSLNRTLSDLCLRLPPVEALVAVDMAIRAGLACQTDLIRYADEATGRAGSRRLRRLALLGEPAESPMETRLRWLLVQGGLPRPEVQTELRDGAGRFVGRADIYYPTARLAIEYDGGNHRERLTDDDRRQNLILNAGFRLLRFTAADLHRPDLVLAQVHGALGIAVRNTRLTSAASNSTRRRTPLATNGRKGWRRLMFRRTG